MLEQSTNGLEMMNVEILSGARAVSGMTALDFAAAVGIAGGAVPKNATGGTILEVHPAGDKSKDLIRLYAIANKGQFLVGLRRDFELLHISYGHLCDKLDKRKDRQITG